MGENGRCHGMSFREIRLIFKIIFLLDINECLTSPCAKTMKCENTPGSYRCIEGCDPGYQWSIKNGECRGKILLLIIEWLMFLFVKRY